MKKIVMIVEDDEALRTSLSDVFGDAGYDVLTAEDGADALSILTAGPAALPCAIFLDLMMPNMNGWEFRAAQLKDPQLCRICTTVMTASTNIGDGVQANHVVSKPVGVAQLLRLAQECCG